MSYTIATRNDLTDYDLQTDLDGVTYTLRFRWSLRETCWYMDVSEEDETPIRMGIKVVCNIPLGARCRDARWPPGIFVALDSSNPNRDPREDNALGDRVTLVYFTKGELPLDFT